MVLNLKVEHQDVWELCLLLDNEYCQMRGVVDGIQAFQVALQHGPANLIIVEDNGDDESEEGVTNWIPKGSSE